MNMKKLVVVCAGLVAFGFLVVAPSEAGETKIIKSKGQGASSPRILISIMLI
jgi:hypothetical protein